MPCLERSLLTVVCGPSFWRLLSHVPHSLSWSCEQLWDFEQKTKDQAWIPERESHALAEHVQILGGRPLVSPQQGLMGHLYVQDSAHPRLFLKGELQVLRICFEFLLVFFGAKQSRRRHIISSYCISRQTICKAILWKGRCQGQKDPGLISGRTPLPTSSHSMGSSIPSAC